MFKTYKRDKAHPPSVLYSSYCNKRVIEQNTKTRGITLPVTGQNPPDTYPKDIIPLDIFPGVKWGFHRPTNHADERYKMADLWNFEKIFGWCYRFVRSADQYC